MGGRLPHIGVLLPNGPEYLFWLNGAALAGAAIVGINPTRRGRGAGGRRPGDRLRHDRHRRRGGGAAGGARPRRRRGQGAGDRDGAVRGAGGGVRRRARRRRRSSTGPATSTRSRLYLLIFTSGTTGVPKAVRCTQGRLAGIAEVAAPGYGYTSDDVCYCPMPLFHGNALMALWGPSVMVGAAIAVRPRFSASAFLDDVRLFGATKFSYVGKAIAYILATPERPDDADNTLTSAFGTEASVRDRSRFRKRFGCYLIEGYGQSEGGAAINPVVGMPKGALGKPVDGVDLAVISPDDGRGVPAGGVRRRRTAAERGPGHRGDRQPERPRQVRGLLPARGRRAGAAAGRVVLDRGPRLRRQGRLLLLRRAQRRLAARRLGELLGRPGRGRALPQSRSGRRRGLSGARHGVGRRRPGHGGARDGAGPTVRRRDASRPGCWPSPTSGRSGSPATSASPRRCRRRQPAR